MIKLEILEINGDTLVRNISDLSVMIERDGIIYVEAIDPAELSA